MSEVVEVRQISPTRPLTIHKPNGSGSGTAAKFNCRMVEEFKRSEGKQFWAKTKGGLFIDLAKQTGQNDRGDATFGWQQADQLITAKLGLPDLSALGVAYQEVRLRGKAVPVELRPQMREQDTPEQSQRKVTTVSLFHRAAGKGGGSTTAITYEFTAQGGTLRISKSRELARNLNCSLAEEYRVFRFLDRAMEAMMKLGAR
jgi:hypothetical protein